MRQPVNVHVFLYRANAEGALSYALLQRSDNGRWQGVSGGAEQGETPEQAALRESMEEAGTPPDAPLLRLRTVSHIPAEVYAAHKIWGDAVQFVPMYHFAIPFDGEITLSPEHSAVRWLGFREALRLLSWDDQKAALRELHARLEGKEAAQ
ncbi:MAG: NUDIX domain-containing protein [Oscillospiraceae bacterium]|jgi:dATP pyrophosphohydrolase|nr:NUDIX domain-containing protein [Oscillospiraceae bacterium]